MAWLAHSPTAGTVQLKPSTLSVFPTRRLQPRTSRQPALCALPRPKQATQLLRRTLAAGMASLHLMAAGVAVPNAALALLNSPNAQIARTTDAALRRSIPAFNEDVKRMQTKLEEVAFYLRIPQRKPWGSMVDNVVFAVKLVNDTPRVMWGVPPGQEAAAAELLDAIRADLQRLEVAVNGKDPDRTSKRVNAALKNVANLEKLQAPGLPFAVPAKYAQRPLLLGRAEVAVTVEKANAAPVFTDAVSGGGVAAQGRLLLELDGYSAPVSAGAFMSNVLSGVYDGTPVSASYNSVIAGTNTIPGSRVPLEILPAGQLDPQYRAALEVQGGELPVLPLSINGAVAFTHTKDNEEDAVSGDEWFMFKFDSQQAGLGGLSFDEGTFGVFGYVVGDGMDNVKRLESGDKIIKVEVVSGMEKLRTPPAQE